jgi:CRP/FNR family transcriptional regulator, cyclic AMP receptor protein
MRIDVDFFDSVQLFKGLIGNDDPEIESLAQPLFIKKKQAAFRPGDPSDSIYVIRSGRVKVGKTTGDGREIILNLLKKGDVFGEMAFLDDGPRDTFAEGLEDTQLYVITRSGLLKLIKRRPAITFRLTKIIGERRKEAENNMESLLYKGVRERLAGLLVRLSEDYGINDSRGRLLRIRITHQDLANLIGSSRETVSLTLGDFRREGFIDINDRKIIIRETNSLMTVN